MATAADASLSISALRRRSSACSSSIVKATAWCFYLKGRRNRPCTTGIGQFVTLIYKPFGIFFGVLAGLLGKKLFNFVWSKVDEEDPPKPTTMETSWPKLLSSAALQGVIYKVV